MPVWTSRRRSTTPTSSSSNITWTVVANNGGSFAARDLTTVKTFLGSPNPGVMIVDKIPAYNSTTLTLVSATATTCPSGDTCTVYYSATGGSGSWSTTFSSTANYVAVLLSGGSGGVELPTNPAGSTGAGAVTAPQVVISIVTAQPTGSGSANSNSVSNIANSVIGGNKDSVNDVPVIAPTIAAGTFDATNPPLTNVLANTTPSTGTTPPGGASNTISTQAYPQWVIYNGPFGNPAATGNYTGGTADNMHDFTEYGFTCTATPATNGTLHQRGDDRDPDDGAERLDHARGGDQPDDVGGSLRLDGRLLRHRHLHRRRRDLPQLHAGFGDHGLHDVASGASVNYLAVYTATGVTPFAPQTFDVTAKGTSGGGAGSESNDTYDVLYPGGALKLAKSVVATTTNCPAGTTPSGPANGSTTAVCPGGVLTYSLAYAELGSGRAGYGRLGSGLGTRVRDELDQPLERAPDRRRQRIVRDGLHRVHQQLGDEHLRPQRGSGRLALRFEDHVHAERRQRVCHRHLSRA